MSTHASQQQIKASSPNDQPLVAEISNLSKVYTQGNLKVLALNDVSLQLKQGEFLAIMGPSGSGKSTLLHCWATLDRPTQGLIKLAGYDITRLSDYQLTILRRYQIGFVFQSFNLLPTLSAQANILLPLMVKAQKTLSKDQKAWFDELVNHLALADRLNHLPHQLSGGQQQRVAIARALMTRPQIIFADEPSGNLDTKTGANVLDFLGQANQKYNQAIVMVTHSVKAASYAQRVIFLKDGAIFSQIIKPTTAQIARQLDVLEK
ncbi:MAG: ABC transporter ATP-binding protein [Candidatus Saccharibacteria bacterium]|nr:ABC transporter ATP-binding protein [Candidatus Saccharibacteria bacterium]MCY4010930.1 ABC transporter ATP-binding protein [Candidatus Saccharibacteria bacterium]MCY4088600.1 ABC transporter ATP-binding protein [Candidatus Saccharibacteria bacterium]